ncbi:hypothetical protein FJT64_019860 [Amphibalanus amphitrite]|uniref:Uncharacterized protein n=1 Tax=Amphibalanus amphitrite TaxID=1232801 RepID=A0A6A4X3I5_AMPAM|nr:hypothetical protein FJT64_019860 [Amphibalanus amphitrite]KAF0308971.1 hypothetical protein FJT64_019860 [Amphibalanus amphitrite]
MAYNTTERPGTLNLRGRGEYVNTKVRTSDRQISEQAEPRDYDPLRSDIWNLHKSSYNRISDLTHNEFHSTTRDTLDRTVQERARLPLDRSHPLHVVRSFGVTDTALSRQLRQLDTGVLPSHPTNHNQHTMQSTYRETYGRDGRAGVEREPRCQTADKWMQFRRRKSWLFDTDKAPSQFTDDALTCPPIPKERDLSEVFPEPDTTHCPGPAAPAPPPPCPRGPAPCPALPAVPGCRPVPPPPGRYRSTYTAGYGDPEAGLRATAAPRSGRELYRGPAPLPGLSAGTARRRDRLSRAVATDREPEVGPTTAAACEESV